MARICIDKKWYEQVEPSTFSELEFELRIGLHAPSVYPHYHVLPFKKHLVTPDLTRVVADLAFVSKDYSEWWVVEVEMGYHDFGSHVKPQVEKLLTASYGVDEAEYLYEQSKSNSSLDLRKLTDLIKESNARVLLVVNQNKAAWRAELSKHNVVTAIFELFRSDDEHEIFRVNGEYPSILTARLSSCTFHPTIPRLLGVDEPSNLDLAPRAIVRLLYNNCVTEWRRIDEGGQMWLTALNRNPLEPKHKYAIYRQNDGQLVLRRNPIVLG